MSEIQCINGLIISFEISNLIFVAFEFEIIFVYCKHQYVVHFVIMRNIG